MQSLLISFPPSAPNQPGDTARAFAADPELEIFFALRALSLSRNEAYYFFTLLYRTMPNQNYRHSWELTNLPDEPNCHLNV